MSELTKKAHRLPAPGQLIIRSMLAAWICMLIYDLCGRDGIVFLSVIAALQCIQPFTEIHCRWEESALSERWSAQYGGCSLIH